MAEPLPATEQLDPFEEAVAFAIREALRRRVAEAAERNAGARGDARRSGSAATLDEALQSGPADPF